MKPTALDRAQAKVDQIAALEPDQRAELLRLAGVGTASQARAIGRAFRVLEQALDASDSVKVGKGGNGRLAERPNWDARLKAAKILWEVLGAAAVKKGANAAPPRTVVNVITPGYASGEATVQPGIVIDVQGEQTG